MRRLPTTLDSTSSDDSDGSDIESCFDIQEEPEDTDADTEPTGFDTDDEDTNPTDIQSDVDGFVDADLAWIAGEDNAHPPEYYLGQENDSDESEDESEDYSDNSTLLLDMIEAQFNRYVSYSLSCTAFYYRIINLTLYKGTANM
jgi:hypothetical protein